MSSPSSDKPDLGPPLLASTISLTVLGALFVLIRLWVRFLHTKAHGWDDYFISVSLVGCASAGQCQAAGSQLPGFQHRINEPDSRDGSQRLWKDGRSDRALTHDKILEILQFCCPYQRIFNGVLESQHWTVNPSTATRQKHVLDSGGLHCPFRCLQCARGGIDLVRVQTTGGCMEQATLACRRSFVPSTDRQHEQLVRSDG